MTQKKIANAACGKAPAACASNDSARDKVTAAFAAYRGATPQRQGDQTGQKKIGTIPPIVKILDASAAYAEAVVAHEYAVAAYDAAKATARAARCAAHDKNNAARAARRAASAAYAVFVAAIDALSQIGTPNKETR